MKHRKKQGVALLLTVLLTAAVALPVAHAAERSIAQYGMLPIYAADIADGPYSIAVDSDSDAFDGLHASLTVTDGTMQATLTPKENTLSELFLGDAVAAAAADEAIIPDSTGAFTLPVPSLDCDIALAVYERETAQWRDCTILFRADSLPTKVLAFELPDYDLIDAALAEYRGEGNTEAENRELDAVQPVSVELDDGEYSVSVSLEGGSGKASVASPTILIVRQGKAYARLTWSSSNYDYMIVGTETYTNAAAEGVNSTFEIPIACWDNKMPVIADTTAMGRPHEVAYNLTFYEDSIGSKGQLPQESAKRVVAVAIVIIVGGGILNRYVKKKRSV